MMIVASTPATTNRPTQTSRCRPRGGGGGGSGFSVLTSPPRSPRPGPPLDELEGGLRRRLAVGEGAHHGVAARAELGRRADEAQLAVGQQGHPVGDLQGLLDVVRDHDRRDGRALADLEDQARDAAVLIGSRPVTGSS
jgi:hypothetical protein